AHEPTDVRSASATEAPPSRSDEAELTEGQILGIAAVADHGEVQMGELGRQKARSPEVKELAAMLVQHHRASMHRGTDLVSVDRPLEEHALASELRDEVLQRLGSLRAESGAAFDRGF